MKVKGFFVLCFVVIQSSAGTSNADNRGMKRKADDSDSEPEPEDNVR